MLRRWSWFVVLVGAVGVAEPCAAQERLVRALRQSP